MVDDDDIDDKHEINWRDGDDDDSMDDGYDYEDNIYDDNSGYDADQMYTKN